MISYKKDAVCFMAYGYRLEGANSEDMVSFNEMTDEQLKTVWGFVSMSDTEMAKVFNTTPYKVQKRRKKLGICADTYRGYPVIEKILGLTEEKFGGMLADIINLYLRKVA